MTSTNVAMKKTLPIMLAIVFTFGIYVPCCAFADTINNADDDAATSSDSRLAGAKAAVDQTWEIGFPVASSVTATLYDDGSLLISGNGDVSISDSSVPWSGSYAGKIETVTIEDGVTPSSMDEWFEGCSNLVSVSNIPNSVKSLGLTFYGCESLVSVPAIPSSVESLEGAFMECVSLVDAPDMSDAIGVKNMSRAFQGCSSMRSIAALPENVEDLTGAFYGCASLVSVPAIPGKAESLNRTFAGCSSLVNTPDMSNASSLKGMTRAFERCTSLENATVIPDTVTDLIGTFAGCSSLVDAPAIPQRVESLYRAFEGCTSLKNVPVVPDSVRNMARAFADCPAMAAIPSGWRFPAECSDAEHCFLVSSDDAVVICCDSEDYDYLLSAYDWEASNRILVAKSIDDPDPVDPSNPSDETGNGDGVDSGNGDDDNAAIEDDHGATHADKDALPQTGDQLLAGVIPALLFMCLGALVVAGVAFRRVRKG